MKSIKLFLIIIRIFLLILLTYYFINSNFKHFASILMALMYTFIPKIIDHFFKIKLSSISIFIYTIIVVSASYLGVIHNFFDTNMYFDLILHTLAGILFFDIGMKISQNKNIEYKYRIIFAFLLSITVAAFWEFGEFVLDFFFNSNNQSWKFDISSAQNRLIGYSKQSFGLIDTMTDIISNIVSATMCAITNYILYINDNRN